MSCCLFQSNDNFSANSHYIKAINYIFPTQAKRCKGEWVEEDDKEALAVLHGMNCRPFHQIQKNFDSFGREN